MKKETKEISETKRKRLELIANRYDLMTIPKPPQEWVEKAKREMNTLSFENGRWYIRVIPNSPCGH